MKKRRAWTLMEKPILLTEYGAAMEVGSDNETTSPALLDDEINPLDATELPESLARKIIGVDSDSGYEIMRVMKIHLNTKVMSNRLSNIRKDFYSEVKEISKMIPEDVDAYRKHLELKIHGEVVAKHIKTWHQTGLLIISWNQ
ncbi:hypothetical protein ACFX2I_039139 [Malus domestica]